ncbi:UvrD-helicase domain-containing protein [Rhodococcoides fascians A21d2]|uniref:UvrD-helicase domain-containing protein n=1 Tax=Nocardiaceae TaxID=85025 RepID=UPI0005627B68|nr:MULTISPECIES: UvrD-helicase domain-containing protein [Rhodococcus]OZC48883.1 hypothetical protein CH286_11150 [Rhodococcus sp. WWJCD1]QIH98490.1 UvrD-helicase domain-containing protein [Rhodococcus fascians A21d2]
MSAPYDLEVFSRERVQAAAAALALDLPHQEQLDFIQSLNAIDVQAAPGSGKTSLVGLKLALFAQAWNSATRGLCVLSHTNTAKDEISSRLKSTPSGSKLERYPHFIGTIQSFTNSFISLPALRSQGVEVQSIDDAAYAESAARMMRQSSDFTTLRSVLGRKFGNGEALIANAHFVWEDGELLVKTAKELPFGPDTASGREFVELKMRLARRGLFRYADMFAIAERALFRNMGLAKAVAHRFPFVLIDETQDTEFAQQRLLDKVFGSTDAVVQRVGDVNQGIFARKNENDDVSHSAFPRSDALQLSASRRFGPLIAEFVSTLTIHRVQDIVGTGPQGAVAVILYDDSCVGAVVPAFQLLVRDYVPNSEVLKFPPRALGARREPGTSTKYPQSISCYIPDYLVDRPITGHGALIQIARAARNRRLDGKWHGAAELIWNTIRESVRCESPLPVLRKLSRDATSAGGRLRAMLLEITSKSLDDELRWGATMKTMLELVDELNGQSGVQQRPGTFAYVPPPIYPSPHHTVLPPFGIGGVVPISPGTIHGAKGETHSATLILECLDGATGRRYDVHEVLRRYASQEGFTTAGEAVRRIAELVFVGASRPTHLLAFAVHRARAEPYIEALSARGWVVKDLTLPALA